MMANGNNADILNVVPEIRGYIPTGIDLIEDIQNNKAHSAVSQ
jgi:hypothetical protein